MRRPECPVTCAGASGGKGERWQEMTAAIIARDADMPAITPPGLPTRPTGKRRNLGTDCDRDLELDLDRVVYDPEYRARVRDALNRGDRRLRRR